MLKAGLESTDRQRIDDTVTIVNGENYNTHIISNNFYTAYFTTEKKNRLTILGILLGNKELKYRINTETFTLLEQLRVARKYIKQLEKIESDKEFEKHEFETLLPEHLRGLKKRSKDRILEAAAISYYHGIIGYPVVRVLLCDGAPQFRLLTEELALCWVHEGRHYKKLLPIVPYNAKSLEEFRARF